MTSPHNASGYFSVYGDVNVQRDHFEARLSVGDTQQVFARTGFLGFIRHTELTESDGGTILALLKYICVFCLGGKCAI